MLGTQTQIKPKNSNPAPPKCIHFTKQKIQRHQSEENPLIEEKKKNQGYASKLFTVL